VIPNLSVGLALYNKELRTQVLGMDEENLDEFDADSRRVLLADAKPDRDWVCWGDGGLELSVPVTSRHVVSLLRELAAEDVSRELRTHRTLSEEDLAAIDTGMRYLRQLLHLVRDFRVESDHLVLVLGDEGGDIDIHFGEDLYGQIDDFHPALRESLVESGFTFPAHYSAPE